MLLLLLNRARVRTSTPGVVQCLVPARGAHVPERRQQRAARRRARRGGEAAEPGLDRRQQPPAALHLAAALAAGLGQGAAGRALHHDGLRVCAGRHRGVRGARAGAAAQLQAPADGQRRLNSLLLAIELRLRRRPELQHAARPLHAGHLVGGPRGLGAGRRAHRLLCAAAGIRPRAGFIPSTTAAGFRLPMQASKQTKTKRLRSVVLLRSGHVF